MKKSTGLGSLLLAGLAAYGIYQLSKMSTEERNELLGKGKKVLSDGIGSLTKVFNGGETSAADIVKKYGEHSYS